MSEKPTERLTVRGRPLRCLLAEMRDVSDWIERTKPQGLLYDSARPALRDAAEEIDALLSALQEAREALGPFADACDSADEGTVDNQAHCWESAMAMSVTYGDFRRAAEVYRALSPGGADE